MEDNKIKQLINETINDTYNFYNCIDAILKKHKISRIEKTTIGNLINNILLNGHHFGTLKVPYDELRTQYKNYL